MIGAVVEVAVRSQLGEAREGGSSAVAIPAFLVDVRNRG
jgi:hypothetical protein